MTIKELLELIAESVQRQAVPDRLWTNDDLQIYFGVKHSQLAQIKKNPKFPRPVSAAGNAHPRYIADEIKRFAERNRG